jgi:hypothetical protein
MLKTNHKGENIMVSNSEFIADDNEEINTGNIKNKSRSDDSFLIAGHRFTSKTFKEAIEKECR